MSLVDTPKEGAVPSPKPLRIARRELRAAKRTLKTERKNQKVQDEALDFLLTNKAVQDKLVGRADRVRSGKSSSITNKGHLDKPSNNLFRFNGYVGKFDAQFECEFDRIKGHDIITVRYAQGKGMMKGYNDGFKTVITYWKDHRGITRL